MDIEFYFLPVVTDVPDRVGYSRKHVSEMTELDKDYMAKDIAIGPRPDKNVDGPAYEEWAARTKELTQDYIRQL